MLRSFLRCLRAQCHRRNVTHLVEKRGTGLGSTRAFTGPRLAHMGFSELLDLPLELYPREWKWLLIQPLCTRCFREIGMHLGARVITACVRCGKVCVRYGKARTPCIRFDRVRRVSGITRRRVSGWEITGRHVLCSLCRCLCVLDFGVWVHKGLRF